MCRTDTHGNAKRRLVRRLFVYCFAVDDLMTVTALALSALV
jgi:hypothetical protein